jgi:hypothetical protein
MQLQELHKAAGGYFFGGDYFTKQLNVFDNTYKLTRPEARCIAKTAQSYQIFSFENEGISYKQLGLGFLTVLCVFPAMFGVGHRCPSVTDASFKTAGALVGIIAVMEVVKKVNEKNQDRIHGITVDLTEKVGDYTHSQI